MAISFVTLSHMAKGGVMMLFIWWGWFRQHAQQARHRLALFSVLLAALAALLVARALAFALPHRTRPMHDMAVEMTLPIGMPPILQGWSSFPSDHAALFGCLATGMFLVSRRAGWIATGYCVAVILAPRLYSGLHYPSDLLAGYGLGALMVLVVTRQTVVDRAIRPAYGWLMQRPGLWYPLFFLISYAIATLFDDLRQFGNIAYLIIQSLVA